MNPFDDNGKNITPEELEALKKNCPYSYVVISCDKCNNSWQVGMPKPCEHIDAMINSMINFGAIQFQIDMMKEMRNPQLHKNFDKIMKEGKEPEIA